MIVDVLKYSKAVFLSCKKAAFVIFLVIKTLTGMMRVNAEVPYPYEYQIPSAHNWIQWFPSRDAACRNVFDNDYRQSEVYYPGFATYRYLGPQASGSWEGPYAGNCEYTVSTPYMAETLRSYIITSSGAPPPIESSSSSCSRNLHVDGEETQNPIALYTQEKYRWEMDWEGRGPSALSIARIYRSNRAYTTDKNSARVGLSWTHNHHWRLKITQKDDAEMAEIITPEGYSRFF